MTQLWTIIGVGDVTRSMAWYRSLLGQPHSPPAHADFGQIREADGTVLLCLHQWGAHEHPSLLSPAPATAGNGLLLFFRVDDYAEAVIDGQPSRAALATRGAGGRLSGHGCSSERTYH